jgi:hypothetical protein
MGQSNKQYGEVLKLSDYWVKITFLSWPRRVGG